MENKLIKSIRYIFAFLLNFLWLKIPAGAENPMVPIIEQLIKSLVTHINYHICSLSIN